MDQLVICKHCGGDACYETTLDTENNKAWMCYGCGFSSNSHYVKGSEGLKKADEKMPELYKDLLFVDEDNLVWYPTTVNMPEKGMVFLDGTHTDTYRWAGVLATEVKEDEKEKFPIPGTDGEYYTKKMDMTTIKYFDKPNFMDALEYVGIFDKNLDTVN
tara:strand:+ start:3115 stop:3591 length:477 start_codon:yes stop_codon:yes gene_type:complete